MVFFATIITLIVYKLHWQAVLCLIITVIIGLLYTNTRKKNKARIQPTVYHVPQNQIKIIYPGIKSNDINIETKSEFETKKIETKSDLEFETNRNKILNIMY